MAVPAKQVRKARAYLRTHARKARISPLRFAAAAHEQKSSLSEVLSLIRYYYSQGDERAETRRSQINAAG